MSLPMAVRRDSPRVISVTLNCSVLDGCHVAVDRRELAPDVEACAALEPETAEGLGSLARRELALERVELAPQADEKVA